MQPIVPKGYDSNQFPPALDASQLAVREATATLAKAKESIESTKKLVNEQLNRYSNFFVPHFGLNPLKGIMEQFFPPGHSVKQGGGAGNSLGIAQEIMAYQNPSPAENNLKLEVIVAIVNGILVIPEREAAIQKSNTERLRFVEEAIFKLDFRPTRDAIVAGRTLEGFDWPANRGGMGKKLSNQVNRGKFIFNQGNNKFSNGYKIASGEKNIYMEKDHADGFSVLVKPTIDYYQDVYHGTPKQFWQYTSKHRLGVEVDEAYGKGYYVVKVYKVDPVTGAPAGQFYAVARAPITQYQGNPGFLLAKVKKVLFPEMYLLSAGVALKTSEREKHYEKQLENAKNMWVGIPDKPKTPVSYVIEQRYSYPNVFNTPNQPPTSPGLNTTTTPINGLRIYLQPTGIEDAMRRILDVNHPSGNAIERWAVNDLLQGALVSSPPNKYQYMKYSVDQNNWNQLIERYYNTIKTVYALLDNPHLHAGGINNTTFIQTLNNGAHTLPKKKMWGDDSWLINEPTPLYTQYLQDAVKIFNYAGWPQAAPQEIFSAAIDEEQDLNVIINMFNKYMSENTPISPGQMYVPESFNGSLNSVISVAAQGAQQTGQAGLPNYNFGFDSRVNAGSLYKKTPMLVHYTNRDAIKKQRYHKGAKTVVTGRTEQATSAFSMPIITPIEANIPRVRGSMDTTIGQAQLTKTIGYGSIGIAALVGLYQLVRR